MSDVRSYRCEPAGRNGPGRFAVCALAAAVSAAFLLMGCQPKTGAAPAGKAPARPPAAVTLAPATTQDVPVYLDEIGKVLAMQIVSVVPQVGGKLIAAHVEDGADVQKGQLLFEIDPRPFEAALASAKATLQQSQAELALAEVELKRTASAVASAAVSELLFDQKKSAVAVAEAHVAAGKAAVQTAELNLEYTKIYSPVAGRAGALLIHVGNVVKEGAAPLLTIQQLDPIYAEFTVTENDLDVVRKSMAGESLDLSEQARKNLKVQVDMATDAAKALAAFRESSATSRPTSAAQSEPTPSEPLNPSAVASQPAKDFTTAREGKLTFLDNVVQAGTVKLRATLPNADRRFWPGQFVNVRLILTTKKNAVVVPVEAQQIGQVGPFVYVVGDDGIAQLRPITPGQTQGNMLVVAKGLAPGEKVIVAGHMMVMPGGPVMVLPPGGGPPGGGPPGAGMPGMPGGPGGAVPGAPGGAKPPTSEPSAEGPSLQPHSAEPKPGEGAPGGNPERE